MASPETGASAVLTFRIGERRLAVDAGEVAEVVRSPAVTRVPQAPAALSGVTNVRGEVIPVVSVAGLLGEAVKADGARAVERLIVLDGAERLGLAVDEVIGLARGAAQRGGLTLDEGGETRVLAIDDLLGQAFAAQVPRIARRREAATAVETRAEAAEVALLTFGLAGQPYALPLEQVREVLAVPEDLRRLPRADAAMLGVMRHRGVLLPVVSTRALLGLPVEPLGAGARIVIAAIGGARVGLAVDEMRAVLHAPASAVGAVPRVLNRGAGEAHIDAMLRSSDGGLVAVLAPERLFREESAAQILEDGRQMPDDAHDLARHHEAGERFLIFRLGEETYGLPIASVQEVVNLPTTLTRVPQAPAFVAGVMSLRGAALPVIDQRRRFGVEAAAAERPRVMVVEIGDLTAGFAVDAISEVAEITPDQLQGAPSLTAGAGQLFDRVAKLADGRVVLLVNARELLDRAEADLVASVAEGAVPTP